MQLEPENSRSPQIPKWLMWAVSQENKYQPTLLAHVVLSTSLVLLAFFCWVVMFYVGSLWEKEWTYIPKEVTVEQLKSTKMIQEVKPSEQSRLIEQFEEIESLLKTHAKIMGFFYKQYYISLSMMGSCASVAVISIFFISKSGWEKVNNVIINAPIQI